MPMLWIVFLVALLACWKPGYAAPAYTKPADTSLTTDVTSNTAIGIASDITRNVSDVTAPDTTANIESYVTSLYNKIKEKNRLRVSNKLLHLEIL